MGGKESKIDNPTANVINEVEVMENRVDLHTIELCLIIMTILIALNSILKAYAFHNKRLKKKYISRANDLDKV